MSTEDRLTPWLDQAKIIRIAMLHMDHSTRERRTAINLIIASALADAEMRGYQDGRLSELEKRAPGYVPPFSSIQLRPLEVEVYGDPLSANEADPQAEVKS